MSTLIQQTLRGRYLVEEIVRQFSLLGFIYRAYDTELDRRVAIRTHDVIDGHPIGEWFVRNEARVLAQLSHPGVQQIFDVGVHEGRFWYAAELLDSSSLAEAFALGPLPRERALQTLTTIADTIGYVHRRGFIHRDLHPSVVTFDVHGQPRVTSFGFAISTEQATCAEAPMSLGKLEYLAPELLSMSGSNVGPAADVWSLGVFLLSSFIGSPRTDTHVRRLIEDSKSPRRRGAFVKDEPLRVEQLVREAVAQEAASLPDGCADIALRCLRAQPTDRYPDAGSLAEALRQVARASAPHRRGPRVFVSHSTRDRVFVEREIIAALERSGIQTWYAKADIDSAEQWERTIFHGLESSEWFIVVMSKNSATSEWVKDEVHWAVKNRPNRILPVLIGECDPYALHIRIARIQWIDLMEDLNAGQKALIERLASS